MRSYTNVVPVQMYEELQVLSPLVPTREFYILRYCQQIEQGLWAIVNVSYDFPQLASQARCHRFPSGCLIQDMPNGYSKVVILSNYLHALKYGFLFEQ